MGYINFEQLEAAQAAADKSRKKMLSKLPKEEAAKFKAVEKAVGILIKARVHFTLFPQLQMNEESNKKVVWQWNSLTSFAERDNGGALTEKGAAEISLYNEGLFYTFFNVFLSCYKANTFPETLSNFASFTGYCYGKHVGYIESKNDDSPV
jgi:hypothetical protein